MDIIKRNGGVEEFRLIKLQKAILGAYYDAYRLYDEKTSKCMITKKTNDANKAGIEAAKLLCQPKYYKLTITSQEVWEAVCYSLMDTDKKVAFEFMKYGFIKQERRLEHENNQPQL